jgi:sulfate permease, SulP family
LALRIRFDAQAPDWRRYVPLVDILVNYRRRDLGSDIVAGLVVGVVTIPQAVAYAFLAGLPAEAGLYACLVPMALYAVFGSSRDLVVGPVAIAALMVVAAASRHAEPFSHAYAQITTVLCLQAGLFLWLLRAWQMGGVVNLLSQPVIAGFVNAAALLIIFSQLPAFTGIPAALTENAFVLLRDLAFRFAELNPATTAIGICSFAVLWLVRRYAFYAVLPIARRVSRRHPITNAGPVIVAAIAIVIVALLDMDQQFGVATVGYVPPGLPSLVVPPLQLQLWIDLAPASAMIALVVFVESYSIGTTLATRRHRRLISNQELIALGAANVGAAFTGAYPVAGSFSRSSVNFDAGARTQLSTLVCAVVIVITLLWLTPLFQHLPHAALAAIIIVSVIGLFDLTPIKEAWSFYRHDAITHVVTLTAVLLFGVESGLLLGLLVSIALFVRRSSRPHIAVVGRLGSTPHFRNVERYDTETFKHVIAVRVDESLYFANANQVETRLLAIVARQPQARHLLIICSAINFVDTSGLDMLERLNRQLERDGIRLHLAEVKGPVMDQLKQTEFTADLSGSVFFTADQAMRELALRT